MASHASPGSCRAPVDPIEKVVLLMAAGTLKELPHAWANRLQGDGTP